MTVRRVFVIWTNPLFHESVRLLLSHPDVIWVGATTDLTTAPEEIMRLHPDTLLFEKTSASIPADVMEILGVETWDIRIIELSLDNNELSLYHREHQEVVEAGDLLQFVLG
jgi:hypothetical protein